MLRRFFISLPLAALLPKPAPSPAFAAPVSTTLGGMALDRTFYAKKAVERLQKKFVFRKPVDEFPLFTGRTVTFKRNFDHKP